MTLNVFDLDKTLIDGDSYDLWHEYLLENGILDESFIAENNKMIELYNKGKLDMIEYLKFSLTSLKSLNQNEIEKLLPHYLKEKIAPIIYKESRKWIDELKPNLIISATPQYIVAPVAKLLGVKEFIGVRLKCKDGFYTDEFIPPLSYKEGKVVALQNYIKKHNLKPDKIRFFTDSINDIALCKFVDEAICVNPDEKLRKEALQNGWQILNLSLS